MQQIVHLKMEESHRELIFIYEGRISFFEHWALDCEL